MQATHLKSGLKVLFVAAALFTLGIVYTNASAISPEPTTELPEGITLAGAYTPDDVAYFQENLQLLHDKLPTWWQHVIDARPFILDLDRTIAKGGVVAITECCDANGKGTVKFGYHLADITVASDADSQSAEARRITFLGVLAHELTHVRDLRAKRFTTKTDRKSCVAAETSGLSQQLEIKRDLSTVNIASDDAKIYPSWLGQQIKAEARDLRSHSFWDWYCGGWDS